MPKGTTEELRRANLAAVLRLVYGSGAMSRALIGRHTGLNRSTVGSLVTALADLGLVGEHAPDPNGRVGRPSPIVQPDPDVVAFAVNPEIDALTLAVVGLDGRVRRTVRSEYDEIPDAAGAVLLAARLIEASRHELHGLRVVGVGVAVPGQVRTSDGLVRNAPHLDWHDEPFAAPLAAATGLPVRAANDAALGALAEHRFGSGRGCDHLVYLNGGASGIGGGIITGGHLLTGTAGYAGELGHVRVAGGETTDSAGLRGTLEAEVTRAELLAVLGLPRATPDELHAALLADRGPAVRAVVARQVGHLGTALAAAINLLNPEVVTLGGFLAALLAHDPDALSDAVHRSVLEPSSQGVRIVPAALGTDLLAIGAAGLAFEDLLADPALALA